MIGALGALLRSVTAPTTRGLFHVLQLPGAAAYYVGRDSSGSAAVLVRASDTGRTVPLRLAGIEARFGIPCNVAEPGSPERTETLTAILCLSRDAGIETYFASAVESLIAVLGPKPTTLQVGEAVQRLVDLFQKLQKPPRRPLAGLVGELCVIRAARSAAVAVSAWRAEPDDRYDFVSGRLRVEAKASSDRHRSHNLSFEQANPPLGVFGLLASIWIEAAGGGTSLRELLDGIEARLSADHADVMRLRSAVAETLGDTLLAAMDWHFDLTLAESSLAWFDMRAVPAIRAPSPARVSGIRFVSDVDASPRLDLAIFSQLLDSSEIGLLPRH